MPTPHIGAEAITPVISATGRIQGNSAIPVYVYTSIPADRRGLGMAAQPVVFITDSDLVENGGQYKLQGRLTALPVIQMPVGSRAIGMSAIPVYDVTNKVWPPAFNPVVPTPPSSFPPITTGLLLNLQADALVLADGDPMNTWTDASGLGHDFTQSGAARPVYQSNGGNPYVSFLHNANQWMLGSDFADNLPSMTLFLVFRSILSGTPVALSKMNNNNTDAGWIVFLSDTGQELYIQDAGDNNQLGTTQSPIDPTVFHVMTGELLSLAQNIVVYNNGDNSNQHYGDNSGTVVAYGNSEPVRINKTAISTPDAIDIQAIMLYSPALSPPDRATMEAALKTKYGIP